MKFKKINREYFITILDRLTRFEPAYSRYSRVFDDIINKFSIDIKAKNLNLEEKIQLATDIINSSAIENNDFYINDILMGLEEKYFNFNQESYQYLSARINLTAMLNQIKENDDLPKNVAWLKKINENHEDIKSLREKYSLLYPIERVILCEGQTEYTLLETLLKLFNVDINKIGLYAIPAGGKNQVARKYYSLIESTKLPFFILLDKDALAIKELIEAKLRQIDDIYILNCGEFEDLIPKTLLMRATNDAHNMESQCQFDDFDDNLSMVNNLENIYKKYGFGEFKKAKFATLLNKFILKNCTKDDFKNSEIVEIIEKLK